MPHKNKKTEKTRLLENIPLEERNNDAAISINTVPENNPKKYNLSYALYAAYTLILTSLLLVVLFEKTLGKKSAIVTGALALVSMLVTGLGLHYSRRTLPTATEAPPEDNTQQPNTMTFAFGLFLSVLLIALTPALAASSEEGAQEAFLLMGMAITIAIPTLCCLRYGCDRINRFFQSETPIQDTFIPTSSSTNFSSSQ